MIEKKNKKLKYRILDLIYESEKTNILNAYKPPGLILFSSLTINKQ